MEQVVNEEPSPEELPFEDLSLLPCHVCNRTFLPKPLKKHIPICEQALRKKRKPFDSLKQRVEGTDMAPFYQKSYLKKSSPEISSQAQAGDVYGNNKVSKWREKHFELQKTIKNAKGTKTDMSTNPPTSTSITPNRKATHLAATQASSNERCPVCDRSFGPKAFDRHVEFCKEQKNRVQVHKSPAVVQQAKERLEARINYRVPPLRQSKRSLVRDKYCPSSQTNLLLRSNSIGPGKSTTSLSTSVTTMASNRRQPISNNERNVEKNNKKEAASKMRLDRTIGDCGDTKELIKNENGNTKSSTTSTTPTNYDPFEKAHLQLMELIEDDNTSASSSLIGTCSTLSTPTIEFRPFVTAISTPKTTNKPSDDGSRGKRTSVIEPPYAFQDNRASRDLDQEFELLESLMNNNLDETSDRPGSNKTTSFQRLGEDIESIDPRLINEQDNLSIPERLPSDEPSPASKVEFELGERFSQERRPTRLLIKPTALIRPGQVRLAPEGSSAGSYSTKVKNKNKMRIDFSPESQKNKNRRLGTSSLSRQASLEVRKALAEEVVEVISTKEETFNINRTPTAEELYPDNPMMYEEFRKYEEMYRREKEGRSSSSKKQKKTADFGINIEDSNKTYADSAYGSLSRKQQMKEDESSDQLKEFGANKQSTATTPSERLPKYCHECGNKYPVPSAKFCVECGVKRLVL